MTPYTESESNALRTRLRAKWLMAMVAIAMVATTALVLSLVNQSQRGHDRDERQAATAAAVRSGQVERFRNTMQACVDQNEDHDEAIPKLIAFFNTLPQQAERTPAERKAAQVVLKAFATAMADVFRRKRASCETYTRGRVHVPEDVARDALDGMNR